MDSRDKRGYRKKMARGFCRSKDSGESDQKLLRHPSYPASKSQLRADRAVGFRRLDPHLTNLKCHAFPPSRVPKAHDLGSQVEAWRSCCRDLRCLRASPVRRCKMTEIAWRKRELDRDIATAVASTAFSEQSGLRVPPGFSSEGSKPRLNVIAMRSRLQDTRVMKTRHPLRPCRHESGIRALGPLT